MFSTLVSDFAEPCPISARDIPDFAFFSDIFIENSPEDCPSFICKPQILSLPFLFIFPETCVAREVFGSFFKKNTTCASALPSTSMHMFILADKNFSVRIKIIFRQPVVNFKVIVEEKLSFSSKKHVPICEISVPENVADSLFLLCIMVSAPLITGTYGIYFSFGGVTIAGERNNGECIHMHFFMDIVRKQDSYYSNVTKSTPS